MILSKKEKCESESNLGKWKLLSPEAKFAIINETENESNLRGVKVKVIQER